jgi:hypothetical protein
VTIARVSFWIALMTTVGCVFDPYYAVIRRAPCAGVDPTHLKDVLRGDPAVSVMRSGSISGDGIYLWCEHDGVTANVEISRSPRQVRVCVGDGRPPNPSEARAWKAWADHLCGRMSAACPELGAWEERE